MAFVAEIKLYKSLCNGEGLSVKLASQSVNSSKPLQKSQPLEGQPLLHPRRNLTLGGWWCRSWWTKCMTAMSHLSRDSWLNNSACWKKVSLNMLCYWSLFSLCPSSVTIERNIVLVRFHHSVTQPLPSPLNTHCLPSDPIQLILVSSDQTTFFHSSRVQSLWDKAKFILSFLCLAERTGLFFFTTDFMPSFFKWFQMVWVQRGWLVTSWSDLVTWTAVSAFPVSISQIAWQISVSESLEGQPPEALVM